MLKSKADKRVLILFYLLISYILIQFAWWAYMLIKLNTALYSNQEVLPKKIWMVAGEGTVFLVFLIAGAFIMQRSIRKEMSVVRQQRNFLLSITHELKTPLAAIKLCVETLAKHQDLDAEKRKPLQKNALANTERLSGLIDKVLLATRIENGGDLVFENDLDISVLVHSIVKRISLSSPSNSDITVSVKNGITGKIDPQYFDSILSNLLENALKYGGDKNINVNVSEIDDRNFEVQVIDHGPGIDPKNKSKIFDKFFREGNEETRTKKGTGLGLFIVQKLVELHRGTISLEKNTPSGSIFKVRLPK